MSRDAGATVGARRAVPLHEAIKSITEFVNQRTETLSRTEFSNLAFDAFFGRRVARTFVEYPKPAYREVIFDGVMRIEFPEIFGYLHSH